MQVGTVVELHRYPVKSMQGERLAEVNVDHDGIRGDRAWAARDEARAAIEGARKLPQLLDCTARFSQSLDAGAEAPVPEIELPDGAILRVDAPQAAVRLSELTGRELTLWPRRPADDAEHYRRAPLDTDDIEAELRAIFARLPDEPLPDLGKLPLETMTSSTIPGTYQDCSPLFLLTRTSLASLEAAQPGSRFDARRFRPNFMIESVESSGFPENAWVGRRLRVGQAIVRVTLECPRCLMTTLAFADLPKDPKIMRALVKQNAGNLGVYASIEAAGSVAEGDGVELLD
jgi:uncharacterized protein YcbX